MEKRLLAIFLALVMVLALLPAAALAAEPNLPDWYFLFAIFKNVDADCYDGNGTTTHTTYTMTQDEIDIIHDNATAFEEYMNQFGLIRARVDVVEINTAITELTKSDTGSYITAAQATPLLEEKGVDLNQYDHVTCAVSLDVATVYLGKTSSTIFENGTGYSCVNLGNLEYAPRRKFTSPYQEATYVHEFLHFMERMSRKWGVEFQLHDIILGYYAPTNDVYLSAYKDIILNQFTENAEVGTGVSPVAWQYPPHVLRTARKLTIPDGVTSIGVSAFYGYSNLESVSIPGSVTNIGNQAFRGCSRLEDVNISNGVASIGDHAFRECASLRSISLPDSMTSIGISVFSGCSGLESVGIPSSITTIGGGAFYGCSSLSSVSIPSSVTSIGYAAFEGADLKDVYYGGSEGQWSQIIIGANNNPLRSASKHYNSTGSEQPEQPAQTGEFADVPSGEWYSAPVSWAVEKGITNGTGNNQFSPTQNCTEIQILTFLWRAAEKPVVDLTLPTAVTGVDDYISAAKWAYSKGMIDGTFKQDTPCTRAAAVKFMWQAAGSPDASTNSGFTDVPATADYAKAVTWAVGKGVTNGTNADSTTFSPNDVCSRAHIVTFLYRDRA